MTNRETLLALAARVEAGETGFPMNEEVYLLFHEDAEWYVARDAEEMLVTRGGVHFSRPIAVPKYTTSLDAIAALTERVLPGWSITVRKIPHLWATSLTRPDGNGGVASAAPTRRAAELAALLRALAEKEKTDG